MHIIEDSYPLSPMQQGMLFHSQYAPQSGVYILQLIGTLHEDLNVSFFKRAWQRVLEQHQVLRTSFSWKDVKEPLQEVHRHVRLPFEEQDWRGISARQRESQLEAYLQTDRRRGFDLTEAPLMRLSLFRMAETRYQFIWTIHHALLDGRSRLLVLKELFAFYEALCRGQDLPLEQPRPYRNYIDWLGKQDFTKAESFWRSTLSGFTAPTPLVVDRPHGINPHQKESYERQGIRLSKVSTSALLSLTQQHQLTPNSLLSGAWAILLSRYSGEEMVVFGATRAGRHTTVEEAESMVGLFINTLPVRVRVPPEMALLPWLKELRAHWIAMRDYEHTSLVKIQQWSDIPAGKPMFESLLVFENYSLNSTLRAQGKPWRNRFFRPLGTTNYPLTLRANLEQQLSVEIEYDRRRFDDATITRMLGHLQTLLEGIVANPEQRLSDLEILTDRERQQLLVEWNDTKKDYPKDKCIHQLFELQVERTPNAVAVVFEDKQLTYRELNARANQLAHYLRKRGVGPEVLVGICVERSLEMIIGLLGILKAGGAYVPLDPEYPKDRLAFMIRDTQLCLLLTQERLVKNLPAYAGEVLYLDRDHKLLEEEKEANPEVVTEPENLAYVMYTSGSTGNPKGVLSCHRGAVNYLCYLVKAYDLNSADIVLQIPSLSFDASVRDIIGSLTAGALVVVVNNTDAKEPAALLSKIKKHRVTCLLSVVPTMLNGLIEAVSDEDSAHDSVRLILVAGEILHLSTCRKAKDIFGRRALVVNQYGPTECTMTSSYYPIVTPQNDQGAAPIGRPIPNSQIYILDSYLNNVPIGVPGELHIGGAGLARGYLNRTELTVEKFIPNPFSPVLSEVEGDEPGSRLYKTGDLARYLPDGNIEFLGRTDHQVKIRGFRIELGEIEAVLGQHAAVQQVIVLDREDTTGDSSASLRAGKRLVAYVIANQEPRPTASELRSFLKEKLPDYMVPSAFVMLKALPLTPNGKVDLQTLLAPDGTRLELESAFVAPRTPVEEVLTGIWSEVLSVEQLGIYDNFFELGGHSLLATQVISRVINAFKVELPIKSLFESPTVADMAAVITENIAKKAGDEELARMLAELESLSDEEARKRLAEEGK